MSLIFFLHVSIHTLWLFVALTVMCKNCKNSLSRILPDLYNCSTVLYYQVIVIVKLIRRFYSIHLQTGRPHLLFSSQTRRQMYYLTTTCASETMLMQLENI